MFFFALLDVLVDIINSCPMLGIRNKQQVHDIVVGNIDHFLKRCAEVLEVHGSMNLGAFDALCLSCGDGFP